MINILGKTVRFEDERGTWEITFYSVGATRSADEYLLKATARLPVGQVPEDLEMREGLSPNDYYN